MYCTYITIYAGSKLPSYYVGSTTVDKIISGYRGSVCSKKYKDIWKKELKENPHLFETVITSYHTTRIGSSIEELRFQKDNDVVKSNKWINMSYASVNGFFGRDVSGKNNPMFNSNHSEKAKKSISIKNSNPNQATRNKMSKSQKKRFSKEYEVNFFVNEIHKWRINNPEKYSEQQSSAGKKGATALKLKRCKRILYNNKVFIGYTELANYLGISDYKVRKLIKNGQATLI